MNKNILDFQFFGFWISNLWFTISNFGFLWFICVDICGIKLQAYSHDIIIFQYTKRLKMLRIKTMGLFLPLHTRKKMLTYLSNSCHSCISVTTIRQIVSQKRVSNVPQTLMIKESNVQDNLRAYFVHSRAHKYMRSTIFVLSATAKVQNVPKATT